MEYLFVKLRLPHVLRNARKLSTSRGIRKYDEVFQKSLVQSEDFWAEAAESLTWTKKWNRILDNSNQPFTKWFSGGELNTCYNALDRHVENGRGEQAAIIYDSPVTSTITKITYRALLRDVSLFAGTLRRFGVMKGDSVLIYMPMVPQTVVAMLASARLGAIHSVVFGGFAAKELSKRIQHAEPKVIVSVNVGVEPKGEIPYKAMLEEAINLSTFKPSKCIIYNRPGFTKSILTPQLDVDYEEELSTSSPVDCVPIEAMEPVYILYTSGTTGMPKAVVRPSGGHAVALNWSMYNVYGMKPGDVWWAPSDLGWIVGHTCVVYGPLLNGNTTILFEGKPIGTPNAGTFFRILNHHDVNGMFITPTALRTIIQNDPRAVNASKYLPLNSLRFLFIAGENCDQETIQWAKRVFKKPVLENWWQTESGWAMANTCVGLNMDMFPDDSTAGKPVPGWDVKIVKPDGSEASDGELGQIVVKLPLPPSAFSTLWKDDVRFVNTYFKSFPGFYDTMDCGYRDRKGYISIMGRTDDVINVSGHRLSTKSMEEAILDNKDIAEAVVVGVVDKIKGHIPVGICVLKSDVTTQRDTIISDVKQIVRTNIGPVASLKHVVIVSEIPKTRSGKVPRKTMAALLSGGDLVIPPTVEDTGIFAKIKAELECSKNT